MTVDFTRELATRILSGAAPAVVGLDPRPEALPASVLPGQVMPERILGFYRLALPVIAEHVPCVKPNIAFFECHGAEGFKAYEATCRLAVDCGLLVIGDIKRGDIGSTAAAYADGHFRWAHAVTLHPYLGRDSLEPFFARCRPSPEGARSVFVLVRTSNPGAKDFQDLQVGGAPLCDAVARAVELWGREFERCEGYSPIGAVVGATWPSELARLRQLMPSAWLLLPGVGAQGGKVTELAEAFDARGLGALVTQSRGVMQAFQPEDRDWLRKLEIAAATFADECRTVATSRRHT